jgi:hypothetical protein
MFTQSVTQSSNPGAIGSGRISLSCVLALAAGAACSATANASSITYSISSGVRSAEATFTTTGNFLTVVLTNTSTDDVMQPDQVLTAVFFDWAPPPAYPGGFTPVSALLTSGSQIHYGGTNTTNVGGEWAYREDASGIPLTSPGPGVSAAGFGLFGDPNFNGSNLQGPVSVAGLEYGLTSAGDNLSTGNTPVTGGTQNNPTALVKNSVTFTLDAGLDLDGFTERIFNVRFQYGTSLNEPQFLVVPLPPAAWAGLGSLACVGVVGIIRRRRNEAV